MHFPQARRGTMSLPMARYSRAIRRTPMARPAARDVWRNEIDLDRLYAQPRCVAAAWLLAALILVMAAIEPAAAQLIEIALAIPN